MMITATSGAVTAPIYPMILFTAAQKYLMPILTTFCLFPQCSSLSISLNLAHTSSKQLELKLPAMAGYLGRCIRITPRPSGTTHRYPGLVQPELRRLLASLREFCLVSSTVPPRRFYHGFNIIIRTYNPSTGSLTWIELGTAENQGHPEAP
jgi:hypothetical protein